MNQQGSNHREFMTGDHWSKQEWEATLPETKAALEIENLYTWSLSESDFMPSVKEIERIIVKHMKETKE